MKRPIEVFLGALSFSFPIIGKKKGYIDEYGPKTPNSTKIAAFICVSECINAHTNQS